ncbi:unnamed protein product [Phytophthora fragariaefolia]|uniref:Unnamed protein product n=1 Tax=Phytophthora fragariaefolia TaxID=1490495 RepID=A0A9W6XJ43_9STRA|nr:unnamed protein product [Phytophthora fragariaefolia]
MADQLMPEEVDTSEERDHDRCGGKDSSAINAASNDAAQWPLVDDAYASMSSQGRGSLLFDTMSAWKFVPLAEDIVQFALDAVRYKSNYAPTVTTRLCLHYINYIRSRVNNGLITFLIYVDGCTSSEVVGTGRCDIYYCRPYQYELQLTQKTVGSTVFIVQSIYKTIDQKDLDEMRSEESNLDFSTLVDAVTTDTGADVRAAIQQTQLGLQTEQPLSWQDNTGDVLQGSLFFDSEEPIAWTNDVDNLWESQPAAEVHSSAQTISLRAEPSAPERVTRSEPGATLVAIAGIATVALSTFAFVLAFTLARFRAQANTKSSTTEYSPLRSTLHTTENTISMTSRDSVAADITSDTDKVEYFSG